MALSPLESLNFLPVDIFFFTPGCLCSFARKSPQNVKKIARFPGAETFRTYTKARCHGFFWALTPGLEGPESLWQLEGFLGERAKIKKKEGQGIGL